MHCITLAKHRFKTLEEYTDEIVEYVEYNIGRGPVVLGIFPFPLRIHCAMPALSRAYSQLLCVCVWPGSVSHFP